MHYIHIYFDDYILFCTNSMYVRRETLDFTEECAVRVRRLEEALQPQADPAEWRRWRKLILIAMLSTLGRSDLNSFRKVTWCWFVDLLIYWCWSFKKHQSSFHCALMCFFQSRWCDVGLREEAFTSSLRTLGQHFGSGTFQHHAVTLGLMVGSALSWAGVKNSQSASQTNLPILMVIFHSTVLLF